MNDNERATADKGVFLNLILPSRIPWVVTWYSDKRFFMTLILCGNFLLFALVATNHGADDAAPTPAATSTATTTPSTASRYSRSAVAADYSQTTTSSTTVHRPYTRNGVYLLMDSGNVVRYVGRGDVRNRIKAH